MSEAEKKPQDVTAVSVAENAHADEAVATTPEPNDTVSKVHKLQQRFYKVCGELYKYLEYVGAPMYKLMLEHYFEQYKREYELMNAEEFIEVDKKIEELKAERDRELEAVKLLRDKQKIDLEMVREREVKAIELEKAKLTEQLAMQRERELEAVKLEHKALTAEIERKREKLNNEIDILWNTAVLEAQIKTSRIIPQSWRRFHIFGWHFGKICKNEAMEYAEISANNEIEAYLATRAQEISEESDEEEISGPEPLSRREYKRWQKQFEREQRKHREGSVERQKSEVNVPEPEETDIQATETLMQGGEPDTSAEASLIAKKVESD